MNSNERMQHYNVQRTDECYDEMVAFFDLMRGSLLMNGNTGGVFRMSRFSEGKLANVLFANIEKTAKAREKERKGTGKRLFEAAERLSSYYKDPQGRSTRWSQYGYYSSYKKRLARERREQRISALQLQKSVPTNSPPQPVPIVAPAVAIPVAKPATVTSSSVYKRSKKSKKSKKSSRRRHRSQAEGEPVPVEASLADVPIVLQPEVPMEVDPAETTGEPPVKKRKVTAPKAKPTGAVKCTTPVKVLAIGSAEVQTMSLVPAITAAALGVGQIEELSPVYALRTRVQPVTPTTPVTPSPGKRTVAKKTAVYRELYQPDVEMVSEADTPKKDSASVPIASGRAAIADTAAPIREVSPNASVEAVVADILGEVVVQRERDLEDIIAQIQ